MPMNRARGSRNQATLTARSEARLVGRRVQVPFNSTHGGGLVGVITSAINGQCLVDLTGSSSQQQHAATSTDVSTVNALRWAAMANACTTEADERSSQPAVSADVNPAAAMVTEATTTAAVGTTALAESGTDHACWHPTWRVRKWLLPDVDGLSDALGALGP